MSLLGLVSDGYLRAPGSGPSAATIAAAVVAALAPDRLLWQATEAILRNKIITNPATGVATIYAPDGTTVLYTASLFKDAAGTVPYNGTGAERRERFA